MPEHLIEAVDEGAHFVLRTSLHPQAVILFQGDALHGVRQIDDGSRDLLLQSRGEPICRQHRGGNRGERNEEVALPIREQDLERHYNLHQPQHLIVAYDRRADVDMISLQEHLRMPRIDGRRRTCDCGGIARGRRLQLGIVLAAVVGGKFFAVHPGDFGVADQPLIAQRAHGFERGLLVAEPQRVDGACAGNSRNAGGAPLQIRAQVQQIHCDVRDHRYGENDDRRYHDDHAQLALDGKAREPTNQ